MRPGIGFCVGVRCDRDAVYVKLHVRQRKRRRGADGAFKPEPCAARRVTEFLYRDVIGSDIGEVAGYRLPLIQMDVSRARLQVRFGFGFAEAVVAM